MKIARYEHEGKEYFGIMETARLISIAALAKRFKTHLPSKIDAFIADESAQKTTETLLKKSNNSELDALAIPPSEVHLFAPIAFPPKILCLGLNYKSHVAETKASLPEEPVVFMKPHTAIAGPNQKIVKRPFVKELDYEGELAVVIGKKAKDVPEKEALNYVFGYTILNDVSARDFQFKGSQWTPGKSFDTFAPTGPCIATKKELPDPGQLGVRTWVNGELRQDGNTRDMIFTVAQTISHLSRVMTLEPCDIIATGTPSGVGMAMKPPKWLNHGDVVRIEIEGVGVLENQVEER